MTPTARWIRTVFCLLLLPLACAEDNRHISPASEAATALGQGGAGRVAVAWDQVMADAFDLRVASAPGDTTTGQMISNVANPFQITDLEIGRTIYLTLTARNNSKASLRSAEIAYTVKLQGDSVDIPLFDQTTQITLAWDDSEAAAGYNIYWRSSPGVTRQNGIKIPSVQNPHRLVGIIPGVAYYFVVTAVGPSGAESSVSEEISYRGDR